MNIDYLCVWCGSKTTSDKSKISKNIEFADEEHIIPECAGGKSIVPVGDVCQKCNNKLSILDRELKYANIHTTNSFQKGERITGKKRSGIRRKEKLQQKTLIRTTEGTLLARGNINSNVLNIINNVNGSKLEELRLKLDFSKALLKCLVNHLVSIHGSIYVKTNYPDLIRFVLGHDDSCLSKWSYGVAYSSLFQDVGTSNFTPGFIACIPSKKPCLEAFYLALPWGLYILGTQKGAICPPMLYMTIEPKWENFDIFNEFKKHDMDMIKYYSYLENHSNLEEIDHKIKFIHVKNI